MLQDKYGPAREWKPESKMRPRAEGNNWAAVVKGEWHEGRASSYDNMVEQVADAVVEEVRPGRLSGMLFCGERQPIESAYSWPGRPSYGCENLDVSDLWQAVAGYIEGGLE